MIKVVIVDDENVVRVGLHSLIDWEANGFEVSALLKNGKEALDFCTGHQIDILITDIKMPVMNGIELIKSVRKLFPYIQIAVISNYDDFSFVAEAFKEGIHDYILKQFIEPDGLLKVLNSMKYKIESKLSRECIESNTYVNREIKEDFFRLLIFGKDFSEQELLNKAADVHFNYYPSNIFCLILRFYKAEADTIEFYKGYAPSISNLNSLMLVTVSNYCKAETLVTNQNYFTLLISFPENYNITDIYDKLKNIASNISESVNNYFNLSTHIGCSNIFSDLTSVNKAYNEAFEALNASFYHFDHVFFQYDMLKTIENPENPVQSVSFIEKKVDSCLRLNDLYGLSKEVEKYFNVLKEEHYFSPPLIKQTIINIIQDISSYLKNDININIEDLFGKSKEGFYREILDSPSIESLKKFVVSFLDAALKIVGENSRSNYIISEAKKYINEHYMENIKLDNIARHIGISSNYFCYLFREKTGESFLDYVSRIRIEKSIKLMENPNLSTELISEMVGYSNSNYFIRVFKKVTGRTISEYKRLK